MISVLLIWIYIILTCFPIGYLCLNLVITSKEKTSQKQVIIEDYIMLGIMILTVYAEYYSLFSGVSLIANIVMLICSLSTGIISLIKIRKKDFSNTNIHINPWIIVAIILITLAMAIGTSRGYFHYDSDLYHGQAIRWIEEMKCVKGLGNLHTRLGYNSASFALCALYSLHFITGQSFHAVAGLLVLITALSCVRIIHVFKDKKILVSDFARIAGLYYIFNIYDEMVSPASDYFVMIYFIYIVIRLLDMSELEKIDTSALAIPALMAVFLITLKISAAGMIVCILAPLLLLIRNKNYKRILLYTGLSILIVLPFLIRNYILTGWLIYPFTKLDLFNPEWKVPLDVVQKDADYIIAYGRGYHDYHDAQLGISEWFPHWLKGLSKTETILFITSIVSLPLLVINLVLRKKRYILHITEISVVITFLMWFISSPLVRYGQGFLIMLPAIILGDVISYLSQKDKRKILSICIIALFTIFIFYKCSMTAIYIKSVIGTGYYIVQQDYNRYNTKEYYIGDELIYLPVENDRTGYYDFPSACSEPNNIALLGASIKEGFKYIKE